MAGTLHVVATPIGNLQDVTLRALRVLREASLIAAEDTRRTARLLAHYDIRTPVESLHEHNEEDRVAALLARLAAGEAIALVSDAGTPLVSDPGARLVAAALAAGHRVEAVPGPSAVIAALVSSGLPADGFTFLGFPPTRAAERQRWLMAAAAEPRTVVFYEAPHRIRATLASVLEAFGDRDVAVARELTKLHEEVLRGRLSAVLAVLGEPRGEFTVVVGPPAGEPPPAALSDEQAWAEFAALTGGGALPRREAITVLARRYGRPSREIYAAVDRGRAGVGDPLP